MESKITPTWRTWAGTLTDDAGTIHIVFCEACRSVRIDSRTPERKSWNVTYVREGPFRPKARHEREPSGGSRSQSLSGRLRALFGGPRRAGRVR